MPSVHRGSPRAVVAKTRIAAHSGMTEHLGDAFQFAWLAPPMLIQPSRARNTDTARSAPCADQVGLAAGGKVDRGLPIGLLAPLPSAVIDNLPLPGLKLVRVGSH
jgi:hypothetical protein